MLVAHYKYKRDLKASTGKTLRYEETSMFGEEYKSNGTFAVVGSSKYKRDWWATVEMENNLIKKVT